MTEAIWEWGFDNGMESYALRKEVHRLGKICFFLAKSLAVIFFGGES